LHALFWDYVIMLEDDFGIWYLVRLTIMCCSSMLAILMSTLHPYLQEMAHILDIWLLLQRWWGFDVDSSLIHLNLMIVERLVDDEDWCCWFVGYWWRVGVNPLFNINIYKLGNYIGEYVRNLTSLTPHVGRIIYFHVIKANINKEE